MDNEPTEDESQDNGFSTKDAFILGRAMGWAYEEGRNGNGKSAKCSAMIQVRVAFML
jgi:hypothetical protein